MSVPWKARALVALFLACLAGACGRPAASPKAPESTEDRAPSDAPVGVLAPDEPMTEVPVEADDPRLGSSRAPVTLVAFLDFQCSFCRRGFGTLQELREKYSEEELRIVFKHLPLESHREAVPAAIIGQAVQQRLGSEAFFEFADLAFSNQSQLHLESLTGWASEVGLSRDDYNALVSDRETLQRVIQDAQLASRLGVQATPTFFVNGYRVSGAQSIEFFQKVIEREKGAIAGQSPWSTRYQQRVASNVSASLVKALLEADPNDYRLPIEGSPVWGPDDALVTLVMFSDYQCPFCKRGEETVEQLLKEYPDTLRVVFKHLPLPFHDQARPAAALATLAQEELGNEAFWKTTELLFERSPELSRSSLESIGTRVGLERAQLEAALDPSRDWARLQADADLADDVLARGTPHFFVNGKRLDGARPIEQFRALIEFELERARKLVGTGVAPKDVYATLQDDSIAPGAPTPLDVKLNVEGRPSMGPADAPLTVAVFSDFQCPYCRKGERLLDQLRELYPGKIRTVWFDFPLPFHDQALPLARAARAAREQGGDEAFWQMHDAIFAVEEDAPRLSRTEVEQAAEALGLDAEAIGRAMQDSSFDAAVDGDITEAERIGVKGTPAFVFGGYLVEGAKPLRFLRRVVDTVLEEQAARSAGEKRSEVAGSSE